jgi:hypothetical protein
MGEKSIALTPHFSLSVSSSPSAVAFLFLALTIGCRFCGGSPYGAGFIFRDLRQYHVSPLPSVRSIGRILRLLGLTRK